LYLSYIETTFSLNLDSKLFLGLKYTRVRTNAHSWHSMQSILTSLLFFISWKLI